MLAQVRRDGIEPCQEFIPPFQGAQFLIGFDEHLLRDVLGIVEVAESGIRERINALFVLVHQKSKGFRLPIEAFVDDIPIFSAHGFAPFWI